MSAWTDLGDDELGTRLVQRGLSHDAAKALVLHRDDDRVAAVIDGVLDDA